MAWSDIARVAAALVRSAHKRARGENPRSFGSRAIPIPSVRLQDRKVYAAALRALRRGELVDTGFGTKAGRSTVYRNFLKRKK